MHRTAPHAPPPNEAAPLRDSHHRTLTYLRHLALLPVLVLTLTWVFAAPASAQTTFMAEVGSVRTLPAGPCPSGAYLCGTAELPGYGAATWTMFITGFTPDYSACGSSYTATTSFTLTGDPASTLVVEEVGSLCGLGHDGAAYRSYFVQGSQAFGHPFAIVGTWTVADTSTGQFAGSVGSGTDRIDLAGAHARGTYTGALGS